MGDPERLLGKNGDPRVRALLTSLSEMEPPPAAAESGWRDMAAQIAVLPVAAAAAATAATQTARGAGLVAGFGGPAKLIVALALTGVGVGVWAGLVQPKGSVAVPPSSVAAPTMNSAAPPSTRPEAVASAGPEVAAADDAAPIADVAPAAPAVSSVKSLTPVTKQSQLDAEAALLMSARQALHSGDARGAQATLNRLQASFPHGVLRQERDVLEIEVLQATGNSAAAKVKARAFLAAFPTSPHGTKLRRILAQP